MMKRLSILIPVLLALGFAGLADAQQRPRRYVWGGIRYPEGHSSIPARRSRLPVYHEVGRTPPQERDSRVLVIRLERPIVIERTRGSYQVEFGRAAPRSLPDRGSVHPRRVRSQPTARQPAHAQRWGGIVRGRRGHRRSRRRAGRSSFPTSRFQIYGPQGRSRIYPAGRSRIYSTSRR